MNKNIMRLLMVFSVLLLTGCSKKLFVNESDLAVESFDFQYFSAKAKIKYEDGKNDFNATANIRLKKDSVIWISITPGMGVEAARLMVTPDTVIFLDRIKKRYLTSGIDKLKMEYDFDFDFHLLESILIGNLIFPYSKEDLITATDGVSYVQNREQVQFNNFIGDKTKKLERLSITDGESKTSISVNYSDFKFVGEEVFPFSIASSMVYFSGNKKTTDIEINFNKAQIEDKPLKFPINVPSKFTPI